MSAFIVAAALAAVLTMATALSVTDFLQLIFPTDTSGSSSLKIDNGANPVMSLLGKVYVVLAAQGTQKALLLYAGLLFVLYGMKNVFSYLSAVVFARIKTGVLYDIRNTMHCAVLSQNFALWSSQAQGQWLSRMSNDVAEYEANVLDSIQLIVSAALTMLIYVIMLLYLDWRLTLLVLVVMLIGTLLLSASRRLKRESKKLQVLNGELMTTTQETLDSLKEIKAATAIEYVNERQQNQNRLFTRRRISLYRRIYAASPLSDFVGNAIVVAILIVGAYRVLGETTTMSPAMFVSYIMIYVLLLTPIKDFSNAIAQFKKGRGVEERINEISGSRIDLLPEEAGRQNQIESIEMADVTFGYGDKKVFEELDFKVPMHSHTAIIGESGSGKTTLGRMIVGLLEPQRGKVMIDNKSTTSATRVGRIAYIPQEPMLFNDTIESNIRFGRRWVTDDDINAAVKMAQLEPVLQTHGDGLYTVIGDGGSLLSGGERQRVNIARALVGNPSVVVMDEATAALDAATEQRFTESMHEMMEGRTLLVIAHRASTVANCDKVFDMKSKTLTSQRDE